MAPPHHTKARKEVGRVHDATTFPQRPAPTYAPRPYTTRVSQTTKQDYNGATRQARRPQRNNGLIASRASSNHKVLSTVWPGRRELSRAKSRKICNGILAVVVVVGIILTVVYTVKKIDQSRHWRWWGRVLRRVMWLGIKKLLCVIGSSMDMCWRDRNF